MILSLEWLTMLAWGIAAAFLAVALVQVVQNITYVTLADGRQAERHLPLVFRLLLPFAENLRRWTTAPRFAAARARVETNLVAAGMEGVLTGAEFLALRFLVPFAFMLGMLGVAFAGSILQPEGFVATNRLVLVVVALMLGYVYPTFWLKQVRTHRHLMLVRALPFVLDLLTLSVEAGMDFMSAIQRNCAHRKMDALNEELLRMTREIQVGTPRRTALRNLAARTGQPDLASVCQALVQADELGVSVGSVLRIQSDQLRTRRFERAEKLANEAPVKMLGPLLLCIFPAVFVILLGPIVLQAAKNLF